MSFGHLTDPQIVDDASPARVAALDHLNDVWPGTQYFNYNFGSAYRPHEVFSTHLMDAMVRAIRKVGVGPTTGLPLAFTITTGDMADNNQLNETQWAIAIMDGRPVTTASYAGLYYGGGSPTWNPDLWNPLPLNFGEKGFFWEPNRSTSTPALDWYTYNGFPAYMAFGSAAPRTQFTPTGIGMPWYGSWGNHDVEVQGNAPQSSLDGTLFKVGAYLAGLGFSSAQNWAQGSKAITSVENLPNDATQLPSGKVSLFKDLLLGNYPVYTHDTGDADDRRRLMSRADLVSEHWRYAGNPAGHGFTQGSNKGYYSFLSTSTDLFKFISLDSNNLNDFGPGGSIDRDQYNWLWNELQMVSSQYYDENQNLINNPLAQDRLVVVYSHHTLDTMNKITSSDGVRFYTGGEIEQLLLRFPNVVLYVDGHTHANRIVPHSIIRSNPLLRNGFWEVTTASVIDWPLQSRIIDVSQKDGILYFDTTMVDIDAPLYNDGDQDISNDLPGSPVSPTALASIARLLAANDPQENPGYGWGGDDLEGHRTGQLWDRNVQLSVPAPFATQMYVFFPASITVTKGTNVTYQLFAKHGVFPYTWSASGNLPPGLNVNATTGIISGTPTQLGTFTSTITATDAAGTTANLTTTWTVKSDLDSNQQANISATQWDVESITFTATKGTPPYTWSVSAPTGLGLTLNSTTGVYSGTLKNYGTFTVYYTVTDATGTKNTKQFTISVAKSSNL